MSQKCLGVSGGGESVRHCHWPRVGVFISDIVCYYCVVVAVCVCARVFVCVEKPVWVWCQRELQ